MKILCQRVVLSSVLVVCGLGPVLVWGDQAEDAGERRLDHDQVFDAVRAGRIQPLSTVLTKFEREFGLPIIDIEFEIVDDQWIYELVVLSPDGLLMEFYFDAASADLIKVKRAGKTEHFSHKP